MLDNLLIMSVLIIKKNMISSFKCKQMKFYFLFLFLLFSTMSVAQNLSEYRKLIGKAENSEKFALEYLSKAQKDYEKTQKPIYQSFVAVGHFFMAKHAFSPMKKLSYFKKGRKMLDEAITREPQNLEMRFLRLISQEKTPKMLGYNKEITVDKNFILKEYKNSNDQELVLQIKKYLNL